MPRGTLVLGVLLAAIPLAHADSLPLQLADFTGLDVSSGIKLVVTPADAFTVSADSAQPDDLHDLKYAVTGGVLRFWYDWSIWRIFNFGPRTITITVTMPQIASLAVSGGGADAKLNGVPGDELRVDVSGGAHAVIDAASAKRYAVVVSGGGSASISGTCYSGRLDASGGATLDARDLDCAEVVGTASGGAHLIVSTGASVTANATGGAHLEIHGHPPQTQVNSSSGGSISFAN